MLLKYLHLVQTLFLNFFFTLLQSKHLSLYMVSYFYSVILFSFRKNILIVELQHGQ